MLRIHVLHFPGSRPYHPYRQEHNFWRGINESLRLVEPNVSGFWALLSLQAYVPAGQVAAPEVEEEEARFGC